MDKLTPESAGPYIYMFAGAIVALWGALFWFIKSTRDESSKREAAMSLTMAEMERFQRTTLVTLIADAYKSAAAQAQALEVNTAATRDLAAEIRMLTDESKTRRKDSGDSGIHMRGPK